LESCVFCRIASREIPARIVLDEPDLMAFEDLNPQAPVHILLIPKKHVPTTLALSADDDPLVGRLIRAAARLARERSVAEDGYRLVVNTNPAAGQSVYHLHVHLLGGRGMTWPPG